MSKQSDPFKPPQYLRGFKIIVGRAQEKKGDNRLEMRHMLDPFLLTNVDEETATAMARISFSNMLRAILAEAEDGSSDMSELIASETRRVRSDPR